MIVFDKEWFQIHQKKLLWLLNGPLKVWFRYVLRIRKCDLPSDTKITKITPNSFSYGEKIMENGGIQRTTDFRTHNKYAKRLYHAFKPFWYLLHSWDMMTNYAVPQMNLNLGFDTLTVYPDAGTGGTTVDGKVRGFIDTSSSFSTVRNSSGALATPTENTSNLGISNDGTTGWIINRFICLFDTSALTAIAVISSTILSLYGRPKTDVYSQNPNIDIYISNPASNNNLVAADYSTLGTISQTGSPITYSSFSTSGYNDFTFDSTGIGNISKTGISKFGSRNQNFDTANTAPSLPAGGNAILAFYTADWTGTTQDPKLVITYTLPSPFVPKITIF